MTWVLKNLDELVLTSTTVNSLSDILLIDVIKAALGIDIAENEEFKVAEIQLFEFKVPAYGIEVGDRKVLWTNKITLKDRYISSVVQIYHKYKDTYAFVEDQFPVDYYNSVRIVSHSINRFKFHISKNQDGYELLDGNWTCNFLQRMSVVEALVTMYNKLHNTNIQVKYFGSLGLALHKETSLEECATRLENAIKEMLNLPA